MTASESWVSFLRGYGPVHRADGMYAETIRSLARHHGQEPLRFDHPFEGRLRTAMEPSEGRLSNIVLTGTAGDGKTSLCNDLWLRLSGDRSRVEGLDRSSYRRLEVDTPDGTRTIHFMFEFSGWAPERGQPWPDDKRELLDGFARSALDPDPAEFFVVAANDGKLLQTFDAMASLGGGAARLQPVIEELLARGRTQDPSVRMEFLNLSRMRTADTLRLALDCLLERDEWRCFVDEADDPAFGRGSPLLANFEALRDPLVQGRMVALVELCDANGFHVAIREVLLLLVNALLGHKPAKDGIMRLSDVRTLAREGRAHEAALHNNLFGLNLSERRREHFAVFRYLEGFRVGQETTNQIDGLLVFGREDADYQEDHARLVSGTGPSAPSPEFERTRLEYLGADDEGGDGVRGFVDELVDERRRMFFRLPDDPGGRYDPWEMTVFRSAGSYRRRVLEVLRRGGKVDAATLATLVRGLNRIWTGMLVGSLDQLFISTGLDFSSARVSDIEVYRVPLRRSVHGDVVAVEASDGGPVLRVSLGGFEAGVDYGLNLVRYEFLTRVASGALPSSFSKECTEDALAFKSQVLRACYALMGGQAPPLALLVPGPDGTLLSRNLDVSP